MHENMWAANTTPNHTSYFIWGWEPLKQTIQYAPNCLEHRKCIKMDLKCPTIVLNCLHILDYIFMVDLKSKNLHMGTQKGQNSQFFKMPEFRPFLRM